MVTGRRAFQGDSRVSTLSAILRDEPKPAGQLVEDLPRELERIIGRCLRKDPERRFQAMPDLKVALEELKQESDSGTLGALAAPQPRRPSRVAWIVAFSAIGIILAVALVCTFRSASGTLLRSVPLTTYPGFQGIPSFSPDGSQIAFS
jgi:serine/threonine protein kinase